MTYSGIKRKIVFITLTTLAIKQRKIINRICNGKDRKQFVLVGKTDNIQKINISLWSNKWESLWNYCALTGMRIFAISGPNVGLSNYTLCMRWAVVISAHHHHIVYLNENTSIWGKAELKEGPWVEKLLLLQTFINISSQATIKRLTLNLNCLSRNWSGVKFGRSSIKLWETYRTQQCSTL